MFVFSVTCKAQQYKLKLAPKKGSKFISPEVSAVQYVLGLASYHLLFQVVEHSDPEQHPAQRKPTGYNKALITHKR